MKRIKQKVATTILMISMIAGSFTNLAKADTVNANQSIRLGNDNSVVTAVAVADNGWTQSDTVVLVSGADFPDALCAGPLAKKHNAPILLSYMSYLPNETLNEIKKLKVKKVIIIGGKGAVGEYVEKQLNEIGITSIQRIGGLNRYNTSILVAQQLEKPSAVVVAFGENFPDALSVSSIASQKGIPIILSSKDNLSDEALEFIKNSGVTKTYIVGGTGVLSSSIEDEVPNPSRLAGSDRYDTNLAVLNQFNSELAFDKIYIATGRAFSDALVCSQLAAKSQSPIILTGDTLADNSVSYLLKHKSESTKITTLGGTNTVTSAAEYQAVNPTKPLYKPVPLKLIPQEEIVTGIINDTSNFNKFAFAPLPPQGVVLGTAKITEASGFTKEQMDILNDALLKNKIFYDDFMSKKSFKDITAVGTANIKDTKNPFILASDALLKAKDVLRDVYIRNPEVDAMCEEVMYTMSEVGLYGLVVAKNEGYRDIAEFVASNGEESTNYLFCVFGLDTLYNHYKAIRTGQKVY